MENQKYYIVGCARSGTTLVRRLMNAFDGLSVLNKKEEVDVDFLIKSKKHNVCKRTVNSIMSNYLGDKKIKQYVNKINKHKIILIYVERSREGVLTSKSGKVSATRYDSCVQQSLDHSDLIGFTVKYEELLEKPDMIQAMMAAKLNLKIKHKWSDYPNFIDVSKEKFVDGRYNLRKIG